jgi:hypothetical protein
MQENVTAAIASDSDLARTGTGPNVDTPSNLTESAAATAVNPASTAGLDESSTADPRAGASPGTPSVAAPLAGHSSDLVAKPVMQWKGITEIGRTGKMKITSWEPPFEVEEGLEGSIEEIIERADLVRAPSKGTVAPTGTKLYGTTEELYIRLQNAIVAQACLPAHTGALLTHWVFSTWFSDALTVAPGLGIIGSAHDGDIVLRTLRNFCRYPQLLTGVSISDLKKVNWHTTPTLLFYDPTLTKQMASLLGCTTSRGYMIGDAGKYKDFYGPKAVYLGDEVSVDRTPRCSVQVNVTPTTTPATHNASRLTESVVQELQNQLLRYRLKNLVKVYNSDFDAPVLTSDTRTIANALGACIVDAPKLQSELISLLTPAADQRNVDRSTSLEGITLEATLNLCHEGKVQILVGEIATEVNRIAKARGERMRYSAETIGHRLKKVGLFTRRLGKAGKGLAMDIVTITRVHELAAVYGGVGLDPDENNLHCRLCVENNVLCR